MPLHAHAGGPSLADRVPALATTPVVVAIPVRDEAERIGGCLHALAAQAGATADAVVLVVNDTRDGSADVARSLAPGLPFALHVVEHDFPPGLGCAGQARRMAMDHAASLAPAYRTGPGVLLTTDADGRVAPDWISRNLAELGAGAEAVAGRAVLDPMDATLIPARLHEDDGRECAYAAVLDEIAALLDPEPWDTLPRHAEHSGASICVTVEAYRRAGGMPPAAIGEDRAFFSALRRVDARIRHAPDVWVTVSGRIEGRAAGGMADTIRRRLTQPDAWLDDALEPAGAAVRRAGLRGGLRRAFVPGAAADRRMRDLARELRLPAELVTAALRTPWFGEAWARLEAASPALTRERVAVADLPREMTRAVRERDALLRQAREGGATALPDLAAAAPS